MATHRNAALPSLYGLLDNRRQNNIDMLRAIAVAAVVIHHAQAIFGGDFPFLGDYGGQFGVQLFFLISGYLISASHARYSVREYATHRFFRIMPAYLMFFLGIGIYNGVITWASVSETPWKFLANLTLMQHLFPAALLRYDALHVSWSLTVEVLWYAAVPLLLWRRRMSTPLVVIITVISTIWMVVANLHLLDGLHPGVTDTNPAFSYLFLANHFIAQACFFAFGSWIFFHEDKLRHLNPLTLWMLGMLVFILRPYYFFYNPIFITGIGLGFFMLAALNSQPVRNRMIFYISETSYAIYLCHLPILILVHNRWQMTGIAGVATAVALTLLTATCSYILVEKPAIRLGRRLARPAAKH